MSHRITLQAGVEPLPGYVLTQVIGKGGFAEVWEARRGGDRVALKFISSATTGTTVKEIKSLLAVQKIEHPGLIRMDHVSSIPGYIVVAMELAEGSLFDLHDAFQIEYQSSVELKLLLCYMEQVARAIDHLNKRQHNFEGRTAGFQHCDIKPSNLLLFADTVKLADFGLCTATYSNVNPVMRMGTLDFAAPEIHRGILTDRSDQYSFAITYYYLRTGNFPFPPPESDKFTRSYSYSRPIPNLNLVPNPEDSILMRALDLAPENRWPCCMDIIKKIRDAHGFGSSGSASLSRSGSGNSHSGAAKSRYGTAAVLS